ncbi:MAG: SGNH/GDSL hydrolase family protein [Chloroflexota bacterium]
MRIHPNSTLLFQGDSITDVRRDRTITTPNHTYGMGGGYCKHIAAKLLRERPQDQLMIYNRGVSGDRITDLVARWEKDALHLKPDIISILIGVNDTWFRFSGGIGADPDDYEKMYRTLLQRTKERLPKVQFVLCEPFVLQCGDVKETWLPEITARQQIVQQLATDFEAYFVPFQAALNEQLTQAPPAYWADDGVHPTVAGHSILAACWYQTVLERSWSE